MNGDNEIYQLSTNHNRLLQQYSNTYHINIQNLQRELVYLLLKGDISFNQKSWSENLRFIAFNNSLFLANDSTKFDALACVHLNIAAALYSKIDIENSLKTLLPVVQRSLTNALQDQPLIEIYSCKLFFQILLSMGVQFNRLQSTSYKHEYFEIVDILQRKFSSVVSKFDVAKKPNSFIQYATINMKECTRLHKIACQIVERVSVIQNEIEKHILHCRVIVYRISTILSILRGFKHLESDIDESFYRAFCSLNEDIIPSLQNILDAGDPSEAERTSSDSKGNIISDSKMSAKSCTEEVLILSVSMTSLQAKICYFNGDCTRAMTILRSIEDEVIAAECVISPSRKRSITAQLQNNMACVHMKGGKWALCDFYLNKSIANTSAMHEQSVQSDNPSPSSSSTTAPVTAAGDASDGDTCKHRFPLSLPCDSYRLSVTLYNNALLSLRGGRPVEAFDAFQKSARCSTISDKPFLWLRMAECSICLDLLEKDGAHTDRSPLVAKTLIVAKLFPSLRSPRISLSVFDPDQSSSTTANAQANSPLSLSSAVSYLQHALILISGKFVGGYRKSDEQDLKDDTKKMTNEVDYDEDMLQAALLKISYVYLKLNEPERTIQYLKELFSIHESRVIRMARDLGEDEQERKQQQKDQILFLAYCYYITALAQAGREQEALDTIAVKRDELISLVATADVLRNCHVPRYLSQANYGSGSMNGGNLQHMEDKHLAATTLQVNKAILLIANDELEQAESLLDESLYTCQTSGHRGCFPAVRCLLYLCIRRGKNGKALRLLQQYRQAPLL